MPAPTDSALLLAARAGDRRAFGALVERHYAPLLRACRRALGDRETGAEVAQEAVLVALLALDRLRREDRFGAWLVGIGLNLSRRAGRGVRPMPLELVAEPAAPGGGPDEVAGAAEAAARVRAALADLPPGQRAAAALFYLGGFGHAEIAARLGISVGAVKARLHKARAALRGRLHDLRQETRMPDDRIPVRIAEIRPAEPDAPDRHVMVLEGDDRRLPVWIGEAEATALTNLLDEVELRRPHSHQFAASLLKAAGSSVAEVRVSRLLETIFYATVVLGDGTEVDARPTDALALALVVGAPTFVEPEVLREAAAA